MMRIMMRIFGTSSCVNNIAMSLGPLSYLSAYLCQESGFKLKFDRQINSVVKIFSFNCEILLNLNL